MVPMLSIVIIVATVQFPSHLILHMFQLFQQTLDFVPQVKRKITNLFDEQRIHLYRNKVTHWIPSTPNSRWAYDSTGRQVYICCCIGDYCNANM
jgi:hypothetical protein